MTVIDKDTLVAKLKFRKEQLERYINISETADACYDEITSVLSWVDTLEVKEVDLEKEYKDFVEEDHVYNKLVNGIVGKAIAKHFFELGLSASHPITAEDRGTAEEIIINLKRVEQDYRIDLTKEIEWLRNKAHKGE